MTAWELGLIRVVCSGYPYEPRVGEPGGKSEPVATGGANVGYVIAVSGNDLPALLSQLSLISGITVVTGPSLEGPGTDLHITCASATNKHDVTQLLAMPAIPNGLPPGSATRITTCFSSRPLDIV